MMLSKLGGWDESGILAANWVLHAGVMSEIDLFYFTRDYILRRHN